MESKTIKSIKIEGIKGYGVWDNAKKCFQDSHGSGLIPNKINIAVPNGFGKSSLTIAISQLNNKAKCLEVSKHELHNGDETLSPCIELEFSGSQTPTRLVSDATKNEIKITLMYLQSTHYLLPKVKEVYMEKPLVSLS